ncbi:MAG: PAS domain-containing protein, partial [Planctomycetaceae bacterium]|nr:PAS domain-containing protein [Planctomycetaceae bacterium]
RKPVDVDDELIQMGTSLGRQFGQYVERIRTEAALVESEQQFRQFAENTQAVFWISSADQKEMLYVNPAYEAVFGRSCKELYEMPQSWLRALHPDDRVQMGALASASPAHPFEVTYRIQRPDGMIRRIHARGFPIRNAEGRVCRLAGIAMDMTDLHRSQEMLQTSENQLRQAQKMEAVGRLAGGVAHDFNNLLTVINGYSQLALGTLNGDHPLHGSLEEILKAGVRASTLTRQLLAFSRKQIIQPKVVEVNGIVSGTEKMLTRLIGEDIVLRADLAKDAGAILADPGQVEQVILNLAVNARDAMPGGGHLTISTAAVIIGEEYAATHQGVQSGPYVQLSVTDTGTGMNDEVKSHLFEPFFTTKEQGKGTGLGLSTVFGIVKQSNGHIWVYSELGKGTSFKILLPQVSGDGSKTAAPSGVAIPRGKETLLLVEDQAEVRIYLATLLRDFGYKVLEARDGEEALRISSDYADPIHLVLTDVVMPHVGGPSMAASLKGVRPGILVVFMSGYAEGALGHQGVLEPGVNFIEKPFMPNVLMGKIRSVLDEANTVSA